MQAGDLVTVHWGACDWSGEEDIDWGYSAAIVVENVRWWKVRNHRSPCGDVTIFFRGEAVSYNIGRLEVISESR